MQSNDNSDDGILAKPLLKLMPWYCCTLHWIVSIVLGIILFPFYIITTFIVFPLQQARGENVADIILTIFQVSRFWILQKMYNKYIVFYRLQK